MLETLLAAPDPQQIGTPDAVARQRRLADAMLAMGVDASPIQSWTQGAARVADALAGVYREHKANALEQSGMAADRANLGALAGSMFGGGGTAAPAAATAPVTPGPQAAAAAAPTSSSGLDIAKADQAIKNIESGGGNYAAIGPVTTYKDGRQDRPYGAHQVMGANIPAWTKQYYGQELTPEQYLANKPAQDAVFQGEFSRLAGIYGPEGAAQAWLGGPGSVGKVNRSDVNGTTVGAYGQRFARDYGQPQPSAPAGVQVASADPNFAPQMPPQALGYQQPAPVAGPGNMPPLPPTGGLPPSAAVAPPGLGPMAAGPTSAAPPQAPMGAPVTTAALPPQAAVAPPQAAPQGAKDSIVQMMIARGINPSTGQALPQPGIARVAQALGGAPQTAAAAPSPAVAQVAQAMSPPQAAPAGPVAAPAPVAGAPQAPAVPPQGGAAQVQAAVHALSNPYASAATKQVAEMILNREMQSQDPLRQMQVLKLQQDIAGGTPQEQQKRALEIQGLQQGLIPKKEFQILNGRMIGLNPVAGTAADVTPANMPPGFRPATEDERKAYGIAPGVPLSIGADGKPMTLGPDTVVNNQSGETAFEHATGEAQAKMFGTMAEDGLAAKTDLGNIVNLRSTIQNLPGGLLGKAQAIANDWGIKLGANASDVEYANAILNKLTPGQRQGMPGAASDRDVAMFRSALPQLSNTPQGNALILDTMQALAEQRLQQGQISTMALTGQMPRQKAFEALQNLPDPFVKMRAALGGQGGAPAAPPPQIAPQAPVRGDIVPQAPAPAPAGQLPQINTFDEYQKLPPGTEFIDPVGTHKRKP